MLSNSRTDAFLRSCYRVYVAQSSSCVPCNRGTEARAVIRERRGAGDLPILGTDLLYRISCCIQARPPSRCKYEVLSGAFPFTDMAVQGNRTVTHLPSDTSEPIAMATASLSTAPAHVDARAIALAWLKEFVEVTGAGNAHTFATKLMKPDGWFRDVLIFTWDSRTLHGHGKIVEYLEKNLTSTKITNVILDETPALCPSPFTLPFGQGIEFSFRFETPIAFARGLARLLPTGPSEMKALSVFVMMEDLKGHEESKAETGLYGGHTITWNE